MQKVKDPDEEHLMLQKLKWKDGPGFRPLPLARDQGRSP
jgi:hypothetical protein